MNRRGRPLDERTPAGNRRRGGIASRLLLHLLLVAVTATMLVPLAWMILTSLKIHGADTAWFLNAAEWRWAAFTFRNYLDIWTLAPFARYFANSIFIAGSVTALQVLFCSLAAFAFARLRFPGRDAIFFLYLATMMVPGNITLIPLYFLFYHLGWVDTYRALILPHIFAAYGTFMLRQFFLSLPAQLEEAAEVDGAGRLRTWWEIILPISKPGLISLALLTFIGNWGSYIYPFIFTTSNDLMTLPLGVAMFVNLVQGQYNWNLLMTGSVLMVAPIVILFLAGQNYFIEGANIGAVKE